MALPLTSTHLPDGTPVIVLLLFSFHFWLAAPLQALTTRRVPLPVPPPEAARQPLATRSSPAAVEVHAWAEPAVQVRSSTWVPPASRHRPDLGLTSGLPVMAAWAAGTSVRAATSATR